MKYPVRGHSQRIWQDQLITSPLESEKKEEKNNIIVNFILIRTVWHEEHSLLLN